VTPPAVEPILWDDWHIVAELARVQRDGPWRTVLFNRPVEVSLEEATAQPRARSGDSPLAHVAIRYGFIWVCLGTPAQPIIDFPEAADPDRWTASAGSVSVATSGLRAVENFLDLGHLMFVHAGFLGEEPHTEIASYKVESLPGGGILATGCRVYQPLSSPVATEGYDVGYTYAAVRPYIVVLYKANPVERTRNDMIALFLQPVSEESCVAHILTSYLKHDVDADAVRRYQQFIFGQDRPILENQWPKRLPLDPRAEVSVRCDASSSAYRRWLSQSGVRFGAIPAP
jgi:phenylpropionate dioxygenase-like ring-hydroxylating dioxygenase large terminal subunit